MRTHHALPLVLLALLIAGCSTVPTTQPPSGAHLREDAQSGPRGTIPAPVQAAPVLPKPRPAAKAETYSVVVNNVRVQELLFALARDAKLNVDIHPGISGTVTLNAIDQTLPQLLNRIAKQTDMRYELDGPNLVVMPDAPFLRTYKVDYVNMSRELSGTVSINTQIASSAGGGSTGSTATGAIGAGNISTTSVKNESKNRFWEELEKNIKDILRETDKILPEGSSETVIERADLQATTGTGAAAAPAYGRANGAQPSVAGSPGPAAIQNTGTTVVKRTTFREAASVIVSPETGVVTVRATARQHEKVQEFLDHVLSSAKRQVLIEATIVEVSLNDGYQQGIDWSRLRTDGTGFAITRPSIGATTGTQVQPFVLSYLNRSSPLSINITLELLEAFGTVKVLSSPRLSVINNQTALLKIVDSIVYFNVKADTTQAANAATLTTFTTTPQSVSVGLVMAVTPQISDNDAVILNVRPTISSVTGFKDDPNPSLTIPNQVPEIRTREIESVLRVASGDIAVLGGLMEERTDFRTGRLPLLGLIPGLGEVVTSRNNTVQKTELVIFLRPVVVKNASIDGDFGSYRGQMPGGDFFHDPQARERRLPSFESYKP
jgi:general secretion pathway protein D